MKSILSRRINSPFHVNGQDDRTTFITLLLIVPAVLAQSDSNTNESATEFDPKMAILMIVLVSAFFLLGFFSIYLRRCAERLIGIDSGGPVDPGAWRNARGGARGLDPSVIESFPTFLYSTVKGLRIGKEALECAVCLNEFEEHETLRLIPKCSHVFHPGCIDAWLQFHSTCPLCRANLVPKPGETISFQLPEPVQEPEVRTGFDPRKRVLDSPDVRLFDSVAWTNKNGPPRSRSTGWKLTGLFPRSNCTDDSLVQIQIPPGGNLERFTLRLPEEEQTRLVNSNLNRSKSHVALSQARSSKSGYRSGSVEERNYFYNDRFDNEGRFDRRPFSITPPYRTGALQSPNIPVDQVHASPPKGLFQSLKLPLDRMFLGKDNVGERSSDCLRQDSHV